MANRSRALVVSQVGKETTAGTTPGGGANLLLPNSKLLIMPTGDPQVVHVPSGHLFPRDMSNALEWGAGTYEMKAAYDESYILFNSLFKAVAGVPDAGTPIAYTRTWSPAVNAMDAFDTYYVESGQTLAVEKFNYLIFNSLKFSVGKQENPLFTGDLLSQQAVPGTTLTSTPTPINSSLVAATSWNCYAPVSFGLVTPKMLDMWKLEFNLGPKYSFAAFVNSVSTGWDALGVGEPIPNSINVTVPMDVTGSDYSDNQSVFSLTKKRAGTPIFLTVQALGGIIHDAITYAMTIAMCVKIIGLPTRSEVGPFVGNTWPCQLFVDPIANGKALQIITVSKSV